MDKFNSVRFICNVLNGQQIKGGLKDKNKFTIILNNDIEIKVKAPKNIFDIITIKIIKDNNVLNKKEVFFTQEKNNIIDAIINYLYCDTL